MSAISPVPLLFALCCSSLAVPETTPAKDYPIVPVDFMRTSFEDGFWKYRLDVNRQVTLPANFQKSEETGRINNFAKAGGLMAGKHEGIFFNDSDVFKIVEGAAYTLALGYDAELDAYLDNLISLFAAAQEEDGYLYTARTIDPENAPAVVGRERWENIRVAHELYNVGHMYEAAVAHYLATGKRAFLDIAIKNADLICSVFGPGKKYAAPGHQEIEIGLVKLYRVTGNQNYLDMARFFIEQRGNAANREIFGDYCQDHKPLVEQDEVVGHSVRAGYFYAGAADVAALTGNNTYIAALDRLWENMVGKKMYLTGGIGAMRQGEQFGANYELPNESAYAETCAAIANILWNQRMFLLKGEAKCIDVLERALYNGFLVGVSLTGDTFFYVNPLAADGYAGFNHGVAGRQPWFDCSCCPTNVVRFLPSLRGYVYAVRHDTVYVNLYIAGASTFTVKEAPVSLVQRTDYPWDGNISIAVAPEKETSFELRLRIPGWAMGRPVPSDLYRYMDTDDSEITILVNGKPVAGVPDDTGYVSLRRTWKQGDLVEMRLPMPARRVVAHDAVGSNRNRIAVERGPIVYCAEGVDNNGKVMHRFLADTLTWEIAQKDILPGVAVPSLTSVGGAAYRDAEDQPNRIENEPITLIPYFAWAHRGAGEMLVWLAKDAATAQPAPLPTLASTARVAASHVWQSDTPAAVNDLREPKASNDETIARLTWWPKKATREWVQYTWDAPVSVGETAVYWFDDAPHGGCRAPASWELQYLHGDEWLPVQSPREYGTALNQYNVVSFTPVTTTALRLSVRLQRDFSAGILEWKILE